MDSFSFYSALCLSLVSSALNLIQSIHAADVLVFGLHDIGNPCVEEVIFKRVLEGSKVNRRNSLAF